MPLPQLTWLPGKRQEVLPLFCHRASSTLPGFIGRLVIRNDTSGFPRLGEVIEAGSRIFRAQCYRLYEAPALGSLVAAGTPAVYSAGPGFRR